MYLILYWLLNPKVNSFPGKFRTLKTLLCILKRVNFFFQCKRSLIKTFTDTSVMLYCFPKAVINCNGYVCLSSFSTPCSFQFFFKRRKCFSFSRIWRRPRLLMLCYEHELEPGVLKQMWRLLEHCGLLAGR